MFVGITNTEMKQAIQIKDKTIVHNISENDSFKLNVFSKCHLPNAQHFLSQSEHVVLNVSY